MLDPDDDHRQAVALFRYGLIADLVHLPPGSPGIMARLQAKVPPTGKGKAREDYTIPGSRRTRVALETLRDWLKRYRRGGLRRVVAQATHGTRGQPRRLPDTVAEALVSIKEQYPKLSVRLVIERARERGNIPTDVGLPASTVHRLLSREGLMVKRTDAPNGFPPRRR